MKNSNVALPNEQLKRWRNRSVDDVIIDLFLSGATNERCVYLFDDDEGKKTPADTREAFRR